MRLISLGPIAAALLAACSSPYSMSQAKTRIPAPAPAPSADVAQARDPAVAAAGARMLVRHAELGLTVDKLDPAERRATAVAKSLGGYVESSASHSGPMGGGRRVTLRIPNPSLDAAIDSMGRIGKVTSRSAGAQDVTDEVVDLDARVTSLRASRDRLRQLLDRAATVADVVSVEKELTRVQSELDALEARLTSARGEVALSRLTVTLEPKHVLGPLGLVLAGVGWVVKSLFFIK